MGEKAEATAGRVNRALATLLQALEKRDSPIVPLLAEGRTAEAVRERFAALGMVCPEELSAYYRWRDGLLANRDEDPELFPGARLLSLDEATDLYRQLTDVATQIAAQSGVDAAHIWDPRWFPVLEGISAEFYIVACGESPEASTTLSFIVLEDPDSLRPVFDSLTSMFETVAAAYDAGLYRLDEDGVLHEDRPAVAALAARLNPGSTVDLPLDIEALAGHDAVEQALELEDDRLRARALVELVDRGDPGAGDLIVAALQSREEKLRVGVTQFLIDLQDPRTERLLLGLLGDSSPMVRSAAALGLGQLKSTEAVPGLTARLQDGELNVRMKAVWALGEIGERSSVSALLASVSDPNPALRAASAQALGRIGDARAIDALVHAMADPFAQVRLLAAWSLGELADPAAGDVLRKALQDDDPTVSNIAKQALARIG